MVIVGKAAKPIGSRAIICRRLVSVGLGIPAFHPDTNPLPTGAGSSERDRRLHRSQCVCTLRPAPVVGLSSIARLFTASPPVSNGSLDSGRHVRGQSHRATGAPLRWCFEETLPSRHPCRDLIIRLKMEAAAKSAVNWMAPPRNRRCTHSCPPWTTARCVPRRVRAAGAPGSVCR